MAAFDEIARGIANRAIENRGASAPGSPAPLRQGQRPSAPAAGATAAPRRLPAPTNRTIFVVKDEGFDRMPKDVRDVALAELRAAWDFVGRLDRAHPMTVVVLEPNRFPVAMAFSDAVVAIESSEAAVAARLNRAIRIQNSNAKESLRVLNVNFQPAAEQRRSTTFEAGGRTLVNKEVLTAGRRQFALPIMAGAVSLESITVEVVAHLKAQVTDATTGKFLPHTKGGAPDLRFYGTHAALREASIILTVENPTDLTKWGGKQRELLGLVLGRVMAHEVRHCYFGDAHAAAGLGTDTPGLFDPKFFRFSRQDEADILAEIRKLERQQAGAILVETFPASRRLNFPF